MSHPERNLKIEYKFGQNTNFCYSPQDLCFHNPCRGRRPRRPAFRRFIYNLICDIRTTFGKLFQTLYGTTFTTRHVYTNLRLNKPRRSPKRAVEGASPYNSEHGRTLFAPTVMLAIHSGQLCPFLTPHLVLTSSQ